MLELLVALCFIFVGAVVLVGILKLLVALIILPFKIAFFLAKSVVGLLLLIPLAIIAYVVFVNAFPIIVFALLLPVLLAVVAVAFVVKCLFLAA